MSKINPWLIALAGVSGLLIFTNPSPKAYEDYATDNLTEYLKKQGCDQVPKELGNFVKSQCKNLLDTAKPQVKDLIAEKTTRTNFILFSIYHTELELNNSLPGYNFETLGLLASFYIYQSEKI